MLQWPNGGTAASHGCEMACTTRCRGGHVWQGLDVRKFSGIQSNKMVVLWDVMGFNQEEIVIWLVVTGTWFL